MTAAQRITDALFGHRWLLLAALAALLCLLAAGMPRLSFSSDSRDFFGEGNQEYLDLLALEEAYTPSDNILLMAVPPQGETFSVETLQTLREMTDALWQTPYSLRVDSAINQMHSYSEGEEVYVDPMLDEFTEITPQAADRFRTLARDSDALRNTMLNEAGDAYGLVLRVVLPEDNQQARDEVEDFLQGLRTQWERENPDWQFAAVGGLLGNSLLVDVAIDDIRLLVPLAFLSVIILFTLAVGSLAAVAVILIVLSSATIATFGFAGWAGLTLTAGTAISPMAVLVLVSTSCIHVLIGAIRAAEKGADDPLRQSITNNLAPVTVSHLTTAFGFACLNVSPSPPLANMGTMVAFGLLFGLLTVFIIIPALLKGRAPTRTGIIMPPQDAMRALARWILRHHRAWIVTFVIAGIAAVAGIARIGYDDNIFRYFDEKYQLRQDADAIGTRLTGLDALQFSFQAPAGTTVFEPEFLSAIDRFTEWLETHPEVVATSSLTGILKDLNQSMSGDDPAAYTIADTQPGNAQLLMFYELSLPVGKDLNVMMDVDRTRTLVSATVRAPHADILRTLAVRAEAWLVENEPGFATRATGLSIAFARISQRNNAQMLYGFGAALFLISMTLMITLRSARMGAVSLVPNLVPALLAFGFWGWTIGDVNLGSTVVTTMTFGIVVDDTVHFLMHFLKGRRAGLTTPKALEDTFAVVGSSISLTSVAMVVGFGIMFLSGYSLNQHIGLLTAIVVAFALLSDLLLLPAILKLTERAKR